MNFHGEPFPGTKELQGHTEAEGGRKSARRAKVVSRPTNEPML